VLDTEARGMKGYSPVAPDHEATVAFICRETSLFADGPDAKAVVASACDRWDCEECGPTKLAGLRALIMAGRPTLMLTLTERPDQGRSREQQAIEQTQAWKKFYAMMCRHLKVKHIPFIWHREAQQNGTSHLHVLMRLDKLSRHWAKDKWCKLTGNYIVHVDAIDNDKGIAAYCTKHTAKPPAKFGNCKRYFASADWDLRAKHEKTVFPDVGAPYIPLGEAAFIVIHRYLTLGWRADYAHPRVVQLRPQHIMPGGP
jgi:hypothetical protein